MHDLAGRVGVTCFAASYGLGVANEVCRVFWPRMAAWPTAAAAIAGLVAQTVYLACRGLTQGQLPIASPFDSLLVVSWLVTLVYLYLAARDRRLSLGLFLLPLDLALVLFAAMALDRRAGENELGMKIVGMAHGLLLLIGASMVAFTLMVSVMYLFKARQLRTGAMFGRVRLPSLERLDRLNSKGVIVAWPLLTLGIGLGFALRELAWSDPKVITTLIAWGMFSALAHYRFRPEHRGQRVAVFTLLAGALVLLAVLGDPLLGTSHQTLRNFAP